MSKIKCFIKAIIQSIKPMQKGKHHEELSPYPILEKLNNLNDLESKGE